MKKKFYTILWFDGLTIEISGKFNHKKLRKDPDYLGCISGLFSNEELKYWSQIRSGE